MSILSQPSEKRIVVHLDSASHVKAVLDASIWWAKKSHLPIGLLHCRGEYPTTHSYASHLQTVTTNFDKIFDDDVVTQQLLLQQASHYIEQLNNCTTTFYPNVFYFDPITHHQNVWNTIENTSNKHHNIHNDVLILANITELLNERLAIIRQSRCPILMMPEKFSIPKTALFAFDNQPSCHYALNWLCRSRIARYLHIHIIMIAENNEHNQEALRSAYARLNQAGVPCIKKLFNKNNAINSLIDYYQQQHLDWIISGACNHNRLHQWLKGSNTSKLLQQTNIPFLLFHANKP